MELFFKIGGAAFAVLLIPLIVALYLGRNTWRWYHITLVVFIAIFSAFLFSAALLTLKTHQAWHTLAQAYERKLIQVERENALLLHGDEKSDEASQLGIEQIRAELKKTLLDRGRMFNALRVPGKVPGGLTVNVVAPAPPKPPEGDGIGAPGDAAGQSPTDGTAPAPDATTGATPSVDGAPPAGTDTAAAPAPPVAAGLEPRTVVYVFDQAERAKRGQYIGEFTVSAVRGNQVDLAPNTNLDAREADRITKSRGPFTIYEVMPIDKHEAFTDLPPDELKALVPPSVTAEYLKDQKQADAKDPVDRIEVKLEFLKDFELPPLPEGIEGPTQFKTGDVAWLPKMTHGKVLGADDLAKQGIAKPVEGEQARYARSLRDYKLLLDSSYKERAARVSGIEQANRDIAAVTSAAASANKNIKAETAHGAALSHDLNKVKYELSEVQRHLQELRKHGAGLKAAYDKLLVDNAQRAAELTNMQLRAADEINRRTGGSQAADSGTLYAPDVR